MTAPHKNPGGGPCPAEPTAAQQAATGAGPEATVPGPDGPHPDPTDPARPDPARPDPARPDTTQAATASADPASADSTPLDPARAHPATTEPAATEPAATEPAATEPGATEPARFEAVRTGVARTGAAKSASRAPASAPPSPDAPGTGTSTSTSTSTSNSAAQTARSRPRAERRVPFPTVDEISRHCLDEDEPETIHVEIHLPRCPEPDRLRAAFAEAMRRHPRILMREAPVRWWRARYEWVLSREPDRDPVSYPGGTLEEARRRALTECPSLDASPPFRAEVVAHEDRWVLLVTINHTALDGPACLRVIATAAELYGGADNAPAPPPVRSPAAGGPAEPPADPGAAHWRRPARVAADTLHTGAPGNGMLIADLPLPARPPRAAGERSAYTVNDQLLVATWIMVARWNREHEQPARAVRVTMPVDDRPRTADMPIGNGTRLVEVTFGPEGRDLHEALTAAGAPDRAAVERLLRATAARTRALKAADRPQLGFSGDLLTKPVVPVGLRAAAIRTLRTAAGPWASTTLLSNIGRIPYPLDFGEAGRAQAVWFSAPARMPRGLSVTTVSTGGRLHLALRWSHARLDDGAGARLGALFARALASTSYVPEAPTPQNPPEATPPDAKEPS